MLKIKKIGPLFPNKYPTDKKVTVSLNLKNRGDEALKYVTIKVDFKPFIDRPIIVKLKGDLTPKGTINQDIDLTLNDGYLLNKKSSRTNLLIEVDYQRRFYDFDKSLINPITVHSRNTVTWADDRIMSVFINPNDEMVSKFARGVIGAQKEFTENALPKPVQVAMILFESLEAQSFQYLADPTQPFQNSLTSSEPILDNIMYPRELLEMHVGDCDDLTALFVTLLENAGVETAFITIPGHIFMMFNTGLDMGLVSSFTSYPNMIYIYEGYIWVPVEVTAIGKSFNMAWELGSQQVHKAETDKIHFYKPRELWGNWVPVSLPDQPKSIVLPDSKLVTRLLEPIYSNYVNREVTFRTQMLKQQLKEKPNDASIYNQIGAVYRTFGQYPQSNIYLKQALDNDPDYVPALYNYARNLISLNKKHEALVYAKRAHSLKPDNPRIAQLMKEFTSESADIKDAKKEKS